LKEKQFGDKVVLVDKENAASYRELEIEAIKGGGGVIV
jgi:hypothetical protein